MRKLAQFVAALMLAGCVTTIATPEDAMRGGYERDQAGNVYPEPCRQPMICKAEDDCQIGKTRAVIQMLPQNQMPPAQKPGEILLGRSYGYGAIAISADLSGWRRADVIRHELCHQIAGDWHK